MSDAYAEDPDEAAALEIGRAFLDARRLAGDIVADAQRRADALLGGVQVVPLPPGQVPPGALTATTWPGAVPSMLLEELDNIERVLVDRQGEMIDLLDRYRATLDAPTDRPQALEAGPTTPALETTGERGAGEIESDAATHSPPFGAHPALADSALPDGALVDDPSTADTASPEVSEQAAASEQAGVSEQAAVPEAGVVDAPGSRVAEAEAGEGAAAVATDAVATVPAATTGLAAPGQGTDPGAGPDPDRSEADLPQPSVVAEWREPTEATVVSEWREPGVDAPSVGGQAVGVASPEGPPPGTQVDEQAPPSSGISAETGMLLGLTPYGQAEAAPKSPSAPALPGSGSSAGDPPDAGTGAAPTSAERPGTGAAGEAPATRRSSPLHSPAVTNVAFAMIGLGVLLLLLVLVKLL